MKILILTCSTGTGHNSVAFTLKKRFEKEGAECVVLNPIGLLSKSAARLVNSAYDATVRRTPLLFAMLYQGGRVLDFLPSKSYLHHINLLFTKKLRAYILENRFDAVLGAHLYPMEMLTLLRERDPGFVPCCGVMTDYLSIPFFNDLTGLDRVFAPHGQVVPALLKDGFPREKIVVTGIPVSGVFRLPVSKSEARKRLGIPENEKTLLVMTGGVGSGDAVSLCALLRKKVGKRVRIILLTGKNARLYKEASEKFGRDPRMRVLPYTKKVALYMKAADVLLSKAGGASSTEAAVAGVPLVHAMMIPGQEKANAAFFERNGMSVCAKNLSDAADAASFLLRSPKRCEAMVAAQKNTIPRDAAERIVSHVFGLIGERERG